MAIRSRVLGPQKAREGLGNPAFVPGADRLWVLTGKTEAEAVPYPGVPGLFTHQMARKANYRLRAEGHGTTWEFEIPTGSARCWARWTNTFWAKARTGGCGRCLARM